MYYDAVENKHGLKYDPFKALVAPRPIGWVGSVSADGVFNLAPYSFFNAAAHRPHYIMFTTASYKDSIRNIHETGDFTCSMSTFDTRMQMNISSAPVPAGVDEFELSGLTVAASHFVKAPRVKEAPAALECRHWKTIELPDVDPVTRKGHHMVIGEVVGIYINDAFIKDGMVDTGAMRPLARMGYMQYGVIGPENTIEINRPRMSPEGEVLEALPESWDGIYR